MGEYVDPKEEAKESWPVWLGDKVGERDAFPDWWVRVGLPIAFKAALLSVLFCILAVIKGHTHVPVLLFWLHLPLFLYLRQSARKRAMRAEKENEETNSKEELIRRLRAALDEGSATLEDEKPYAPPSVSEDYRVHFPLLLGETGLETFCSIRHEWDRYEKYEYVGESGSAFVVRLIPKNAEADAQNEKKRGTFWRQMALSLPGWVTTWIFFGALEQHGFREDTLAALCACVAHTFGKAAFERLGKPRTNLNLYLIFDGRVVTTGEAFARLNRYLSGTAETPEAPHHWRNG